MLPQGQECTDIRMLIASVLLFLAATLTSCDKPLEEAVAVSATPRTSQGVYDPRQLLHLSGEQEQAFDMTARRLALTPPNGCEPSTLQRGMAEGLQHYVTLRRRWAHEQPDACQGVLTTSLRVPLSLGASAGAEEDTVFCTALAKRYYFVRQVAKECAKVLVFLK